MHYIRLLRRVQIDSTADASVHFFKVLLTITTDLGDDFYAPSNPVPLSFVIDHAGGRTSVKDITGKPSWEARMRVLSLQLRVPVVNLFQEPPTLRIFATSQPVQPPLRDTDGQSPIPFYWSHGLQEPRPQSELIIPCHYVLQKASPQDQSYRSLPLRHLNLLFEEELGESIARHLWDAGLITASFISDVCVKKETISKIFPIASNEKHIRVLELGCGIGVLGTTVAAVLEQIAKTLGCEDPTMEVLLTDVGEAEDLATSNINAEFERMRLLGVQPNVKLAYENLDWDDGRHGRFGPLASQRWDFVILSDCTYNVDSFAALVGTLSAIHAQNCRLAQSAVKTRVLLATKPRHSSEESFFEILEREGWLHRVIKSIPIIRDNAEDEVVHIYMLEKFTAPSPSSPAKRRAPSQPTEVAITMGEADADTLPTESAPPSPVRRKTPDQLPEGATRGDAADVDASPTGPAPLWSARRKTPGPLIEEATPGDEAEVVTSPTKKLRASKGRS